VNFEVDLGQTGTEYLVSSMYQDPASERLDQALTSGRPSSMEKDSKVVLARV